VAQEEVEAYEKEFTALTNQVPMTYRRPNSFLKHEILIIRT
jgi:hypothetical protein